MSYNTSPILVALSGSILLVMMVSVLGLAPRTTPLQADISAPIHQSETASENPRPENILNIFSPRTPEELRSQIAQLVADNKPDEAKKLYDELYLAEKYKRS